VLCAALKLRCPPVVDLCGVIDTLLGDREDRPTGHELLITLSNQNNMAHITQYIRTKLTGDQARIVNIHLQWQPERVTEFVNANPVLEQLQSFRTRSQAAGIAGGVLLGLVVGGSLGSALGAIIGGLTEDKGAAIAEDCAVDCSDALQLVHNQGESNTWYAHATTAVLHMALLRIIGRQEGCPSIEEILIRILQNFPPGPGGRITGGTEGSNRLVSPASLPQGGQGGRTPSSAAPASGATLGLENVLKHFGTGATCHPVLMRAHMVSHRLLPDSDGQAVVLISFDARSLTFLNSWGHQWGNNGSFSAEDHTVLELDGASVSFMSSEWRAT
jgi:hypothetical protein